MKPLSLIDKVFLLKRTSLFSSLDLDLLFTIADKLGLISYSSGDEIFPISQNAHRMYLISKGIVQLRNAENQIVARLTTAEFFGDESLFNEKPRGYAALAESDVTLLTLSRTHLSMIISECPSVAMGLLQEYAASFSTRSRKEAFPVNHLKPDLSPLNLSGLGQIPGS